MIANFLYVTWSTGSMARNPVGSGEVINALVIGALGGLRPPQTDTG